MCGGYFDTNIYELSMITNHNNVFVIAYSYVSIVKQKSGFFTDFEVEGARRVQKLQQPFNVQEHQTLRHTYVK